MRLSSVLRHTRNRRGATLPLVGISLVALISVVALAVDMGMLYTGRSEAQRTADAAALAGASAFITYPDVSSLTARNAAWERAALYSRANPIRNASASSAAPGQSETTSAYVYTNPDLVLSVSKSATRVDVLARRMAVSLGFARIFGLSTAPVSATAAAQVVPGGTTNCLKPILMADNWLDRGGNSTRWDSPLDTYDRTRDGWSGSNFGQAIDLSFLDQQWNNNSKLEKNSFLSFVFPNSGSGATDMRNAITGKGCGWSQSVSVNDPVVPYDGLKWGGGFRDAWNELIAADKADNGDLRFNETTRRFERLANGVWSATDDWQNSYRVVPIAFFDPGTLVCGSSYCSQVRISGLVQVFVEGPLANNVKGLRIRIIGPVTGTVGDCEAKGTCSPDIKALRLVN
jgi:Flp pilus assembly protein TadG